MKIVFYAFGRLIVICIAVLAGILSASLFIGYGIASGLFVEFTGLENYSEIPDPEIGSIVIGVATFVAAAFTGAQIAGLSILPVTIVIAITEMVRWRALTIHLVLGGVCALFVMFSALELPTGQLPNNGTVIVSLAAGFVATFFYWLIAGRNAGEWLSALEEQDTGSEDSKDA